MFECQTQTEHRISLSKVRILVWEVGITNKVIFAKHEYKCSWEWAWNDLLPQI